MVRSVKFFAILALSSTTLMAMEPLLSSETDMGSNRETDSSDDPLPTASEVKTFIERQEIHRIMRENKFVPSNGNNEEDLKVEMGSLSPQPTQL